MGLRFQAKRTGFAKTQREETVLCLEGRKPKVTRGGGVGEAGRCWVVEELVFGRKHGLGFFFPFNCFLINCLTVWAAEQCHRNSHEVWSLEV